MPFAVVEEKLRTLPEEYLVMVADYIDLIKSQIVEKEAKKTFAPMFQHADNAASLSSHEKFSREELHGRGF